MLYDGGGNRNRADGQLIRKRARHARVDDALRLVAQDHRLGAHRREHFADAADRRHDLLALQRAAHKGDAADGLGRRIRHKGTQRFHLHVHRRNNTDHVVLLLVLESHRTRVQLGKIALRLGLGRRQAQVAIVAALAAACAEDRAFVSQNLRQRQPNLPQNLGVVRVAHQQIETRLAAHRPEVYDGIL